MPLFSIPLSGLSAASEALSVISNNLANINTDSYKDQSASFQDLFYQGLGTSGSGDPIQTGNGVSVAAISSDFKDGGLNTTGVPTDMAITGNGFFVTQLNGVTSYSRDGHFTTNSAGQLVTQDGALVMGYPVVDGAISSTSGVGPLSVSQSVTIPPSATTSFALNTNLNASASVGDSSSTPLTVYDSLGNSHVLTFQFTKTAANSWNANITIPNADLDAPATWTAAQAYSVGQTVSPAPANGHWYQCTVAGSSGASAPSSWPTDGSTVTDGGVTWQDIGAQSTLATTPLVFDSAGKLTTPSANVSGILATGLVDGAAPMTLKWNLFAANGSGNMTQLATAGAPSTTNQDGYPSGALQSFTVDPSGVVEGVFSSGQSRQIGQVALANFVNVQGLQRDGSNNYGVTLASGQASLGTPGSGGRGTITGGALELSNVDVATEFAKMIVAQRSYEANAKVVTTFDQVAQDTIALKQM